MVSRKAALAAVVVWLSAGAARAAVIWTGEAPGALCAIGRTLQVSTDPFPRRHGGFRRRGELTAEILAPAPLAGRVARAAGVCATEAAAGATSGDLLAEAGDAAEGYGETLTACLRRKNVARFVGQLTFWIDSGCDL